MYVCNCTIPEKNPHPPHGRSEILWGSGWSCTCVKAKILEGKYQAELSLAWGRGV